MSDNKDLQDYRDRQRVSGEQDYEVNYLADELGVSGEQVKQAIAEVGNDRTKIEEYLAANRK